MDTATNLDAQALTVSREKIAWTCRKCHATGIGPFQWRGHAVTCGSVADAGQAQPKPSLWPATAMPAVPTEILGRMPGDPIATPRDEEEILDTRQPERTDRPSIGRDQAITLIRAALKRRSGKAWSVRGGTGTAWGWISIGVTNAQATKRPGWDKELATLLGLDWVGNGGKSVPASSAYYQEYVDRAEGREPSVYGKPYWD